MKEKIINKKNIKLIIEPGIFFLINATILLIINIIRKKKDYEIIPLLASYTSFSFKILKNFNLINNYLIILIFSSLIFFFISWFSLKKLIEKNFLQKFFEKKDINNNFLRLSFLLLSINPLFISLTIYDPLILIFFSLFFLSLEYPLLIILLFLFPYGLIFSFITIIFYLFQEKEKELIKGFISFITGFFIGVYINKFSFYFLKIPIGFFNNNIITEFGNPFGLSLFLLLISIIILFYYYKKLGLYKFLLLLIILLLSPYFFIFRIISLFIIIFFSSLFILYLKNREWLFSELKKSTLLLITLLIIFSSVENLTFLTKAEPNNNLKKIVGDLKKEKIRIIETDNLLKDYLNYNGILVDNKLFFEKNIKGLYKHMQDYLEKNKIKYILINDFIKEKMIEKNLNIIFFGLEKSGLFEKRRIGNYELWLLK